jgi:hypothetical protein
MQLLAAHPKVIADRTYPMECNAGQYWMHMCRALTQADGGTGAPLVEPGVPRQPGSVIPQLKTTPPLAGYMGTKYPPLVGRFCRDAIDGFYGGLAAAQHRPEPAFFCEKMLDFRLGFFMWNLYPNARQIFLVRDFRDVVCSVLSFNKKRGVLQFGRERVESDEAYVPDLKRSTSELLSNLRSRGSDVLLVRYEELLNEPRGVLGGVLDYLGLERSEASVEAMITGASTDTSELKQHRTSSSVEASVGRWRTDLSPKLQALCRSAFDELLPQFGYKLDRDGNLLIGNA